MSEIKFEIHEQDAGCIVINGKPLSEGDSIPKDLGLFEGKIDRKLLSILAYLSVQKISGINGRWISADEIAFSVLPTTTGIAVSKYLERKIRPYFSSCGTWSDKEAELALENIPLTHLIQYMPRHVIYMSGSGGTHNGLSRGPYRLGAGIGENYSINAAWSLLLEKNSFGGEAELATNESLSQTLMEDLVAKAHMTGGMLSARQTLSTYARNLLVNNDNREVNHREKYMLQAEIFYHLGSLDMELGYAKTSIYAAERSLKIFDFLKNRKGMADALQLMAHGYGQIDQFMKAYVKAAQARNLCDSSRVLRVPDSRAYYIGVLGQRASKIGDFKQAERLLSYAQYRCSPELDTAWSFRRAENFIGNGELDKAKFHLEYALANADGSEQTIPYQANISRVAASYFLYAGEVDNAEKWLAKAKNIGIKYGLTNHIRLVEEIECSLRLKSSTL